MPPTTQWALRALSPAIRASYKRVATPRRVKLGEEWADKFLSRFRRVVTWYDLVNDEPHV